MKEGWDYKKLGEVCKIYQPQTIASSLLKEDGKYPVFGANGMIGRYDSYNHEDPEVLLCCRGATCGAINVSLPFSWINGNAMVVKPINDSFLKSFLRYILLTLDYSHIITGAAQPQITRTSLSPVTVPVPTIIEQQSIVDYLDSAFAKIDAMKANAEKALNEAKALFQASLKEMLEPKEGWEEKTIGKILNLRRGHDLTHSQMNGSNYPVAGSNGQIGTHNYCTPISPCITVGRSGSVGAVNIYKECWAHNTTLYIDDFKGNYPRYLYYLLKSIDLGRLNSGSAVPTLNRNFIHPLKVRYIKDGVTQKSIVSRLDSLSENVKKLEENQRKVIAECDALKQAILRQVFE